VKALNEQQFLIFKFWFPPIMAGVIAWGLLYFIGETPLVRASGLALVIVGVALSLRRMGSILAVIGSLTLCLSPAFWSQTGGGEGDPARIVIAIIAAILAVAIGFMTSQRPYIGLGLGVIIFVGFFFSQIGTPRSIRLTSFVVGWLLFLVIDMLLLTNPHPEDNTPQILLDKARDTIESFVRPYHTLGILLLFTVGVLNDPLITLLAPALVLAFVLTRTPQKWWYWVLFGIVVGIGMRGFIVDYIQTQSYLLDFENWRNANRWLSEISLIINQFTLLGILFGVLGLARLSRWYPPLGTVTLIAYVSYAFFGLVYIGRQRETLLLPLFIIQLVWITYAVFTLSQWVKRLIPQYAQPLSIATQLLFAILPIVFLLQVSQA
jgi:hypothetical protein